MSNVPESPETPEERVERTRQEGENARQRAKLTFWMSIFTTVFGFITTIVSSVAIPLMLRTYHIETTEKVDATKAEVSTVKNAAKEAAAKADIAADKAEKATDAVVANSAKTEDKLETSLLQWKAYHTQKPEDIHKAVMALAKSEGTTITKDVDNTKADQASEARLGTPDPE